MGHPWEKDCTNEPVMNLTIHRQYDKKGISCTLYDPRINKSRQDADIRFQALALKLQNKDKRIGFTHCHDPSQAAIKSTKYGNFAVGSPLSYQLAPNENNLKYITNIQSAEQAITSNLPYMNLLVFFYSEDHEAYPREWLFDEQEIDFLKTLYITFEDSHRIEQETVKQRLCDKWYMYRKHRIASSKAHSVYTRKTI